LQMRAEVSARDIAAVHIGQVVEVRGVALRGARVSGRVSAITPMLRANRLLVRAVGTQTFDTILEVVAHLDEAQSLVPGMRVDTYFQPMNR
jgi:hypothetical protein